MMEATDLQPAPIEIRPEVTVLSVLRHLNYKAWFAIAEFIDNALQSAIANGERLRTLHDGEFQLTVDVQFDPIERGQIVITDNAAGISVADFPRAFRAAQTPTDRSGLSEFGMGMKSAACWFAETWSVRTKAIGESVERTIYFDVKHIVENKIEHLNSEIRNVDPAAHYTVVSLRGLHHLPQGRTVAKIKEHLASIYRVFLRDGRLILRFNGESLSYQSPQVLKAIRYTSSGVAAQGDGAVPVEWRKEIHLDFGDGQRVTGFAALREVGSTPLAGFALFRRDRLIVGSLDDTYRPAYIFKQTNSYAFQRLFGELHVEGFEVSHTKDGFRWEAYEDIFLEFLKKAVEAPPLDLLAQAQNYRALPSKKSIEARAVAATASVAEYLEKDVAPLLVAARQYPAEPAELPPEIDSSPLQASERTVTVADGDWHWVITLRTSVDPARDEWVSLAKMEQEEDDSDRVRRLSLDLSLAHPFSTEFIGANNENVELLLRLATAVCVSLVLSEDLTGEPPQSVLYHFNYLLRGALARTVFNNDNIRHDSQQNQASLALGT
ncbi:MAG TPA: ATP-binding protein [Thiobacillus sp.]|nr:MAG: ATP-binding protein [Hydrogenophilales bacterium 28-61-11]OYZ58144.1 MAG: ATP-binding protein [Hydrogenophilales bacterium 16-61-112]OZA48016.1 MAG: ATP-binding protein [Hydrogenophilales bacterium 17-61-76]HQT29744.1 ATP-binding protein [Thiobacillus sp.]HQT70411.1 ATP-binding protein [Thiobacillus sp.]